MLVTYKTSNAARTHALQARCPFCVLLLVGYRDKIYQSCLLTAACQGKDTELMKSFARHLASERVGVIFRSCCCHSYVP